MYGVWEYYLNNFILINFYKVLLFSPLKFDMFECVNSF